MRANPEMQFKGITMKAEMSVCVFVLSLTLRFPLSVHIISAFVSLSLHLLSCLPAFHNLARSETDAQQMPLGNPFALGLHHALLPISQGLSGTISSAGGSLDEHPLALEEL